MGNCCSSASAHDPRSVKHRELSAPIAGNGPQSGSLKGDPYGYSNQSSTLSSGTTQVSSGLNASATGSSTLAGGSTVSRPQEQTFPEKPLHQNVRMNFVVDTVGVLEPEDAENIRDTCLQLLQATKIPIVVATVSSLNRFESNISEYAIELFDEWGIGHANWNIGILLLCWRHRPHWNFAIRMGRDWTDSDGHITRIDNLTNEIMKRNVLEVLSSFRPLNGSKALRSGVLALSQLARSLSTDLRTIVKPGPPLDRIDVSSSIFGGGKCFRIVQPSPFPSHPQQGSWFEVVLDTLQVMSETDKSVIHDRCIESLGKVQLPIVLVTLSDGFIPGGVGDDFRAAESIRKYALGMFNKFRIGHQDWNFGILCILVSKYNCKVDGVVVFGRAWGLQPTFREVHALSAQLIDKCKVELETHTGCEPIANLVTELTKFASHLPARPDNIMSKLTSPYIDGFALDMSSVRTSVPNTTNPGTYATVS